MRDDVKQNENGELCAVGLADAPAMEIGQWGPSTGVTLLTVAQIAAMLQVSEAWVRDHSTRKNPRLKCVKVGKLLRYRLEDIEEFIATWCQ
jgi:hypothetical protein